MLVRMIMENDVLASALPRTDDDAGSEASQHTAQLYEDMSDDEFSDTNSEFFDEVAHLEREYFDALHVENVLENAAYANSDGKNTTSVQDVSSFVSRRPSSYLS